MESELSSIFPVKLVTKNIVRGSPGTQFMHVRVNVALFHVALLILDDFNVTLFDVALFDAALSTVALLNVVLF